MGEPKASTKSWTYAAVLPAFLAIGCAVQAAGTPAEEAKQPDEELQLGQEAFKELKAKGEIIESSPLYDLLQPLADSISKAAQPHYNHPFKFYLVHEAQPNAFSVPGGNVFVVDSLMTFARNKEELTGVLCHEVAHTLHHHSMMKIEEEKKLALAGAGAVLVLGPTLSHALAIKMLADLRTNGYSRNLESQADITGSDVCAAAGYNPWGLVWLFQDFKNASPNEVPQLLSDHPSFDARIR